MKTLSLSTFLVFFCLMLRGQEAVFPPLPDSCFDAVHFFLPTAQTKSAKEKFTRQLDSLLALPKPDSFSLGLVYRRLAVVLYSIALDPTVHKYALKSLQIFEKLPHVNPIERAKSKVVYAYSLSTKGRYDTLAIVIQNAIEQNKIIFGDLSEIQEHHYRVLGLAYNNVSRYKEALTYLEHAIRVGRQVYQRPSPFLARSLYVRGIIFYNLQDIDAALKDLFEAEKIIINSFGHHHPAIGVIHQWIGNCYYKIGDFDRALEYLQQSLLNKERSLGTFHDHTLFTHTSLGDLYLAMKDYPAAVFHHEKAFEGYTHLQKTYWPEEHIGPDKTCRMVRLYAIIGDYEKEAKAFRYYIEKCTEFGTFGRLTGYTTTSYQYHAFALLHQNKASEALFWLDKTLEVNQITNPNNYRYNHEIFLLKAEALTQLQRFQDATAILQDILNSSPLLEHKKEALDKLAAIHFKKSKNQAQQTEFQQAWNYQLQALQTLDSMRYAYQSSASRIQQAELNFHLFESALNTSYERHDLNNSFWITEKSKASALLDNQRDDLARRIAGLPDSLLYRESIFKSQIAELEKTIYEKPAGPEKKADEASLFEKKQNLNTLLESFEKNYPLYFKLKYNTILANVAQIQANLPPATAILEYFVGDSSIFIFSITPTDVQLQRIPKPRDFETNTQNLRQSLTSAELRFLKKDFAAFSTASSKLYTELLATPLAALPPGIQHLIIVPDGSLNYVPFEILGKNTGSSDFKTYPYLLKNYNISYATSANLWLEQTKTGNNRNIQNTSLDLFAGFAPSYNHSDTLSSINSRTRSLLVRAEDYEIPGAALEVQEIAKLLNGKTWLGEAATKNLFKQQSPNFRVLHLAMHSIMDDANPLFSRLLFTQLKNTVDDNDLYANDLYNMRLPAQLVVLSACNTGNGKLRRGEGVMSLSRAFTFTGVPSTVMSLWKAPDEATRKLMLDFYQNLKMGMSKDEALQRAKLRQLAAAEAGMSSPFFWAGFVANGDMRALFGR